MILRNSGSSSLVNVPSASHTLLSWRVLLACVSICLLLLGAGFAPAWAQVSQASIRGNVHDATGAVVPNAQLRLINVATGVQATTTSNEKGDYLFLNLNPGNYTLEASSAGFASQKLNEFALAVNQTSTLDFMLAVGNGTTEVVQVNAIGEGVQASTAEVGSVLGTKQVEDLPLNSRNFTSLLSTTPGVSPIIPGGSQVTSYTTSIGPILIPSFNGQTNRSDLFYLDGVLDVETFGNAYAVQPIIDTIEDQKMQSHNDSAEFGGSTGGTINIATKAGTNSFHGGGWEFNQTSSLQALPYFTPAHSTQPALSQNQFGGEIGGPVIIPHFYNGRDKTFFYGAYEGYRYNSPGTALLLVPTVQQLAGDFQGYAPIYDPATTTCTDAGVCTRQQFDYQGVPNTIDPARLNQGDLFYAKNALPAVAATPPSPGYNASEPSPTTKSYNSYDVRVDETITQKDSAFFRISGVKGPSTNGRSQLPNTTTTDGYQWALNYVHIFSPSSVLHIQGGKVYLNRLSLQRFKGLPANFASTVGFPTGLTTGYVTLGNVIPGFQVDNYFSDQGENGGPQNTANGWSFNGDYTYVLGRHTLKAGAGFNKLGEAQDIEYGNIETRSNETNSLVDGTSGDALASFEIGVPNDATKRNLVESLGFGGVFDTFLQDQWQVNSKLTVNIGVRYDLGLIPRYGTYAANNEYSGNFDFNNGTYVVYKVPGSCAVLNNAPCIPTPDGSLPTNVVASKTGKVLNNTDLNLQPRFGFAYRLLPTTVVRGGFGVAFDEYAALVQNVRGVSGNWPSVGQIQQTNFNVPTPAKPFPGVTPQTIPNLTSLPPATPFGLENWYVDPNLKDAYSMQWNFGVQRQIDNATVVSATYVASENRRLSVGGFYNTALTPGPGNPTLRQPYPYISPTFYSRSNGSGNYNALQLQLNRSFSHGLGATVAYTWSKSIDEGCSGFFGSEGCNVQQIYNIKADRSVSAFDVPQNFVVSWNYQLPIGRGKELNINNRALDMVVGGWQFNGLSSFHSGTPYSINISEDIANIGAGGYERPNLVKPTQQIQKSLKTSLNPYELEIPAQYTYGDMGRNALRTAFSQNFDLSLFKEVSVEHLTVQLRAEAFDALNHPIWGQPGSTFASTQLTPAGTYQDNYGNISSTANSPRSVQLGVKVLF